MEGKIKDKHGDSHLAVKRTFNSYLAGASASLVIRRPRRRLLARATAHEQGRKNNQDI